MRYSLRHCRLGEMGGGNSNSEPASIVLALSHTPNGELSLRQCSAIVGLDNALIKHALCENNVLGAERSSRGEKG